MQISKTIALSPEQEQILYREWGLFYTKKQNLDVADLYYNKSLALNNNDPKALNFRSRCKRHIAQTEEALSDAEKALALDEFCQPYNLEVCDGIYELNDLEKTQCLLSNYSKKFIGKKVDDFSHRRDILNVNFNDTVGDTLGYFILEQGKHFKKVHQKMLLQNSRDTRPLWKILKDEQKCDVLSILEEEKIIHSHRERARRNRGFTIFNQIYMGKSWIDVLFLKALRTDKNLMLPQSQLSRPILQVLTNTKYDIVIKLLRMLHVRCPLYTKFIQNCPNRAMKAMQRERFLFCVQNQVHRSTLQMLKTMNRLRKSGRLQELRKYVEEVMGDYVTLKTHRVMPLKFQFINEVYNILALAYCDHFCSIPMYLTEVAPKDRLIILLKLKLENENEAVPYEFGKRETYQSADANDKSRNLHLELTARLEKRLKFAKYPIERAYLWYEIARSNLNQHGYHKCSLIAARSILEAKECNSLVWMLHATMMICKVNALLRKIEKVAVTLKEAMRIAKSINNRKIIHFLELCIAINTAELDGKHKDSLRLTKSRLSLFSSKS